MNPPNGQTLGRPIKVESAIRETSRPERLAGDLSALSRAEEGRIDLRTETFGLGALAVEVAERLRPQFEGKGVTLEIEAESTLRVVADRDRTAQAVANLVGNALAYTPAGGRALTGIVGNLDWSRWPSRDLRLWRTPPPESDTYFETESTLRRRDNE